jgi:hypothetical protein
MKHSDSLVNLAPALAAAQAEMPAVGFDSQNPFLKNQYASLGAVISVTRPILAKHGLSIVQFPASAPGIIKRDEPIDEKVPTSARIQTEREGIESIGVETVLLHQSGEWLAETLFIPIVKEKGKSTAQVSGSIISYLRRYAWSSVLGLYADEDDDGTGVQERGGYEPGGRFDDLPQDKPGQKGAPSSAPPAGKAPATPASGAGRPMVAELIKRLGPNLSEFVRCLQERDADGKGGVVLVNKQGIDKLPDAWASHFLKNWDNEIAMVDLWCAQNPPATGAYGPVEVPRDANLDPNSPDAPWRSFTIPWGQHKGTALAKVDKKVLFGFWANFTVETEYKGAPKKAETIAADTKFREMLDEAGKHYEFHVSN